MQLGKRKKEKESEVRKEGNYLEQKLVMLVYCTAAYKRGHFQLLRLLKLVGAGVIMGGEGVTQMRGKASAKTPSLYLY